eukprot:2197742-Prymnesium_polylepis.1
MAQAMEPMDMTAAYDEQPTNAAPRVAAAAKPHTRRVRGGRWRRERPLERLLEWRAGNGQRSTRARVLRCCRGGRGGTSGRGSTA